MPRRVYPCYFDVIHKGERIGDVCQTRGGYTVNVRIGGEEYCQDFFYNNRYDLKMAVIYWIRQIERGDVKPWLADEGS